ncbi:MAG: Lrp/AsnC family transcriptional regulator [archaeon]
MDDMDKQILKIMQEGGYCVPQSVSIGRKLGIPPSTVRERIGRMQKDGTVKKMVPLVDPAKIGLPILTYMRIRLRANADAETVVKELLKNPEVEEAYWMIGTWGILLKIRTQDNDAYYELSAKKFAKVEGVAQTEGIRIAKVYKEDVKHSYS